MRWIVGDMLDIWIANANGSGAIRPTNTAGMDEEVGSCCR